MPIIWDMTPTFLLNCLKSHYISETNYFSENEMYRKDVTMKNSLNISDTTILRSPVISLNGGK